MFRGRFFRMKTLAHLCPNSIGPASKNHMSHGPGFTDESIYDVIQDINPDLSDIMHQTCVWQNDKEPCSNGFVPVYTEEGLCFAFNNLSPHEIYTEE